MKFLFIFTSFLFLSSAHARPIEISVRDYGWITSFPVIRDVLDFYVQGVENDVNDDQPILDPSRVNYGTANSSVMASKGLGTDYVNNPEKFSVSLGLGAAWDAEKDVAIRDEISGAAAASSVTIGARMNQFTDRSNIFGLDTNKLMGYVNFGVFQHSQVIPGRDIDIAGDINATNFGLHLRYDLMDKTDGEWFGWGGLKLHVGYEFNDNDVELTSTLDEVLEVDTGGAGTLSGRLTGKPTLEVETLTHSFPLEISTSFYFLKAFSFYLGTGADLNIGNSESRGDVKGDISTLACTSGVCVGETVLPQLEAQANYEAKSQVRNLTFRAFTGLQVSLPFNFHAYGQASTMLGTDVIGLTGGLRYIF